MSKCFPLVPCLVDSFEFLIPRRPVSVQKRPRTIVNTWKGYVRGEAAQRWGDRAAMADGPVHLTLVYLCDDFDPVDTDNIIKPIQDALIGLVYGDDVAVTDVASHRRSRLGTFDASCLPGLLVSGLQLGTECVYVRVGDSVPLEELL